MYPYPRIEPQILCRLLIGSFACAVETLLLLRNIISHGRWTTAKSLMTLIRDVGNRLVQAQPIGRITECFYTNT
jgi:translation initiation factor 2B subunit (eIF-2B alpha/beta/delta family)